MRILLWHGYRLSGTGSNECARALALAWSRDGHDVTLFSQEPRPEHFDIGAASAVRPDIDGILPVFVLDRYEGLHARLLPDFTPAERDHYVRRNAAALREHLPADLVYTNHVLMGGPVGAATGARYTVSVHGSELEYSMRGRPDLARLGQEALRGAAATYVGSAHAGGVLTEICGPVPRVHQVPSGVDTDRWRPRPRLEALAALAAEPSPAAGVTDRLTAFLADDEPTVVYVGRLLHNKGVHLLLKALDGLDARAVIVGSGGHRADLAASAPPRTLFTGPLGHRQLVHLLPLADVSVVPSIFPEAFGMVAAEAAASGTPPLVARHSGLAEIAARLASAYPPEFAQLTSFEPGDPADLHRKLRALLLLPPDERRRLGLAARQVAVTHWGWPRIARHTLDVIR
ncbi:glycosyltransferase family 4 protein [Dactylosporangium cerinum]|uniref:Glycosyltransferase family 4 protein n=1 Tax=Dactylosporangium cerinum TaxID=1434730 RepID=A0ABV9VRV4_9ACTN